MLKQQQEAWQQVLGTNKVCSLRKAVLSWQHMLCYDCDRCTTANFMKRILMQGGAENTMSASSKDCNMECPAVNEGQSKISRSDLLAAASCSKSVTGRQALLLCPTL